MANTGNTGLKIGVGQQELLGVAQKVERGLWKLQAVGSSPTTQTKISTDTLRHGARLGRCKRLALAVEVRLLLRAPT